MDFILKLTAATALFTIYSHSIKAQADNSCLIPLNFYNFVSNIHWPETDPSHTALVPEEEYILTCSHMTTRYDPTGTDGSLVTDETSQLYTPYMCLGSCDLHNLKIYNISIPKLQNNQSVLYITHGACLDYECGSNVETLFKDHSICCLNGIFVIEPAPRGPLSCLPQLHQHGPKPRSEHSGQFYQKIYPTKINNSAVSLDQFKDIAYSRGGCSRNVTIHQEVMYCNVSIHKDPEEIMSTQQLYKLLIDTDNPVEQLCKAKQEESKVKSTGLSAGWIAFICTAVAATAMTIMYIVGCIRYKRKMERYKKYKSSG